MNKTPDESIVPDKSMMGVSQIQKSSLQPDESQFNGDETRLSLRKRKEVVIEKFKGITESFDDFEITNDEIHKVATKFYEDQHEKYLASKLEGKGPEEPWDIWRILKTGVRMGETFLKFRMGIKFFQFTLKGQTALDDENIGEEVFDNPEEALEEARIIQYNKFTKQIYLAIMFVLLGIGIIIEYVLILGTEKTQSLKYKYYTFLEYNITEVPRLFPMHELAFFEKQQVIDRMKCKLADVEEECYKIEEQRCSLYPATSEAYEICSLNLYERLEWNQTQFCVDHYENLDIWTNTLNPKYPLYHERKYDCFERAGLPKGKEYCDTMNIYYEGWQTENLFNCYTVNGVDFARDFCEYKFDIVNLPTKLVKQNLLRCNAFKNLKKTHLFCDINNEIAEPNIPSKTQARIDCYDSVPLKSKHVCDAKEAFLSGNTFPEVDVSTWDKARLQDCYKEAGHEVLDQDFCLSFYDVYKETDKLYDCYTVVEAGIERDRQYCEWKFVDSTEDKYACIDALATPPPKGGDYCYLTYLFGSETEDLYTCLESEGLPKDSTYCSKLYNYNLLEAKKLGQTVDISTLHTCQETNGGIPNNPNQCKTLMSIKADNGDFTQKLVKHSDVTVSQVATPNEVITRDCQYAKAAEGQKPWWKAKLETPSKVQRVKVFNTLNGADPSNLNSAEVYVGGKLCGKMPKAPTLDTAVDVVCEDVERSDEIEVRGSTPGSTIMVCDVQVFAEAENTATQSQMRNDYNQCLEWQNQCLSMYTDPLDAENKFNCLARYGVDYTPEFCLQQNSATSDLFHYPLRNRYMCLANKKSKYGKVKVDREVDDCIAIGKEYLVEECLANYESKYEKVGFRDGGFDSYGNLTTSYADIARAEAAAQALKDKTFQEMYKTQVPIWIKEIKFTEEEIEEFLCNQTDMFFYSNPYNDAIMAPEKSQKEIILNMKCEVFSTYDAEAEEDQVVVHYYMDKDLDYREITGQTKLYINRTELNQQYFEFAFYKDLEFLEVRKNQLFMREQNPKKKELDIPTIKNNQDYQDFLSYNMSVQLMESWKQVIGIEELERTILDTAPQQNVFVAASKEGSKKIFGIEYETADYKERLLVHEPEVDLRMVRDYSEEERNAEKFSFQVAFQATFTEKNFKFTYYSMSDMFIELGSMQTIAMGMIAAFMYYIVILFVIDLIKKIQRMHQRDRRQHARRKLKNKLPQYKRAIKLLKRKAVQNDADEQKILELNQDLEIANILLGMLMPNYDESDDEEDLKIHADEEEQEQTPKPPTTRRPTMIINKGAINEIENFETENEPVDKKAEVMAMQKLEQFQFQYEQLVILEKKYGSRFAELGIIDENVEVMDDFKEIDKFLEERCNKTFSEIVTIFQGRLSYFGIYYLNDTIELTMARVVNLRKQLAETTRIMLGYQNKLLEEIKQERKDKVDHINHKFSILSEFNNMYNAANYRNIDQIDFDKQVKNLDLELDEIRKLIASGAESKFVIKGMKKRLTVKKPDDPGKLEMLERIAKVKHALIHLDTASKVHTQLDPQLKSSVENQDNDQIKQDIDKFYEMIKNQEYNPVVNSISRIVKKMTPDLIGETKEELSNLNDHILHSIEHWEATLDLLQELRDNHHQLYWGEFELQIANLYAFKDEESTQEIAELQEMLNSEQKAWNDSKFRMEDMVEKLQKAKTNLATLAFN